MTQAATDRAIGADTTTLTTRQGAAQPSQPGGTVARCPRCSGRVFNDHGDSYCMNCGTLHSIPRAWDGAASPGDTMKRQPCITVGCINRAVINQLCRTCHTQHERELFFASQASV